MVSEQPNTQHSAGDFFHGYAADFDAIYGGHRSPWGRILDRLFRRSMRLRYQRTLENCHPIQGASALDIGCGPGHYAVALACMGAARVVGIDLAEGMLQIARARAQEAGVSDRCVFLQADFLHYEFSEPFDYCFAMGVMDYVADPGPFVRRAVELARCRAIFSFPEAGGWMAAIRRRRYRHRTALYLYHRDEIVALMEGIAPGHYTVEQLARDYVVTVSNI